MSYLNPTDPRSSSGHILNADGELDLFQQKLWFSLNLKNNLDPDKDVDPNLRLRPFVCDPGKHWDKLADDITPSRKVCNMFWMELPWTELAAGLDGISIMDYGCSAGNYALNFMQWTEVPFLYHGFDVRAGADWEERMAAHSNLRFTRYDGEFQREHMPAGLNFFMSQSAMEHVVCDLTYFEVTADYIRASGKPAIHVHQIPSAVCLDLYGLHGVRQYTPRTVSGLTRLYPDAICTLFSLGGPACSTLHFEAITKPETEGTADWRIGRRDDYNRLLRKSIEADMASGSLEASFYALVIECGVERSVFDG